MQTILVADDEPKIVSLVAGYLEASGFHVLSAFNGKDALELDRAENPDCLILDINMPGLDGLDVAREVRKISSVPVIFLSARTDEVDRIVGLELGADDYVSKPFSPRELVSRVKAVLRRTGSFHSENESFPGSGASSPQAVPLIKPSVLVCGDLTLDAKKRSVTVSGKSVSLTTAQFDILSFMMREPGRVWTRLDLLEASSGTAFEGYDRTIDVQIKNIRKALGDDHDTPRFIETVRGIGYRIPE